MPRFFKNKVFLLTLITVMIFIVMGVSSGQNSKINWLSNVISIPLTPVQKFLSFAGSKIEEGLSYFEDTDIIKQENEQLRIRVNELEKENRELQGFREENRELRAALNLKVQFDKYDQIGANVIAKDPGNWFDFFTIDIGTADGIAADSAVITSDKGLIGRVTVADIVSSRVITIIDEQSAVSSWISKTGGAHVIVMGDLSLKNSGLCRVEYIPLDANIEVGDIIETSGLGGIYPKGIVIGKVKEVRKANNELNRYAIIEPVVNFKRLEEVYVLKKRSDISSMGGSE